MSLSAQVFKVSCFTVASFAAIVFSKRMGKLQRPREHRPVQWAKKDCAFWLWRVHVAQYAYVRVDAAPYTRMKSSTTIEQSAVKMTEWTSWSINVAFVLAYLWPTATLPNRAITQYATSRNEGVGTRGLLADNYSRRDAVGNLICFEFDENVSLLRTLALPARSSIGEVNLEKTKPSALRSFLYWKKGATMRKL